MEQRRSAAAIKPLRGKARRRDDARRRQVWGFGGV